MNGELLLPVDLSEAYTINLINVKGVSLHYYSGNRPRNHRINTLELPKGIYFLQVKTNSWQ